MTKEQEEAIARIKYNDIAKPLSCGDLTICNIEDLETVLNLIQQLQEENKQKKQIINSAINEVENLRQYFSEDLQVEFIGILEILKNKKVIDW